MDKEENFQISEEGKGNYIIRSSATYFPDAYLEKMGNPELSDSEYLQYLEDSVNLVYNQLKSNANILGDTIGIWITNEDDVQYENSLDVNILNAIKESGQDINPIGEFIKMTLGILPDENEEHQNEIG